MRRELGGARVLLIGPSRGHGPAAPVLDDLVGAVPALVVERSADPADVARRLDEGTWDAVVVDLGAKVGPAEPTAGDADETGADVEGGAADPLWALDDVRDRAGGATVVAVVEDDRAGQRARSAGADEVLFADRLDPADPRARDLVARTLRHARERTRLARALAEARGRLADLVEAVDAPYLEVDLDGRITAANDALGRWTGRPPDELVDRPLVEVLAEDDGTRLTDAFGVLYDTAIPLGGLELTLVGPEGDRRPVRANLFLKQDPDGRPAGFWGTLARRGGAQA